MARSACDPVTNCDAFKGDNARYLPKRTFSVRTSLFNGPEQIDLYHFGRGHTNGDTFVVFRAARTVHTGDMFQRKALPFVDVASSGGSAVEFGQTLTQAVEGLPEIDTVIAGHVNEPLAWQDFTDFAGFYNHLAGRGTGGDRGGPQRRRGGRGLRVAGGLRRFRRRSAVGADHRATHLRRALAGNERAAGGCRSGTGLNERKVSDA